MCTTVIGLLAFVGIACADTITLRAGRTIQGTYLGGTARQIRLEVGDQIQLVNVNDVLRIEFSGSAPQPEPTGQSAPLSVHRATEPVRVGNAPTVPPRNVGAAVALSTGTSSATVQSSFIATLGSYKERYATARNEFQQSSVRRERASALARILPTRAVDGWIGKISSIETTRNGEGILAVHPLGSDWITVTTSNNSLSGAMDGTLISSGSALYEQISRLSIGESVIFSGSFRSSDLDYLEEVSLTERGSIDEPEFIFTFVSVRPTN